MILTLCSHYIIIIISISIVIIDNTGDVVYNTCIFVYNIIFMNVYTPLLTFILCLKSV